jgi:hypothetical protein
MATFDEIIEHFGGTHQSLADALGCTREAVTMWNGIIPESRAFQIEVLSKGKFRANSLPSKRRSAQSAGAT